MLQHELQLQVASGYTDRFAGLSSVNNIILQPRFLECVSASLTSGLKGGNQTDPSDMVVRWLSGPVCPPAKGAHQKRMRISGHACKLHVNLKVQARYSCNYLCFYQFVLRQRCCSGVRCTCTMAYTRSLLRMRMRMHPLRDLVCFRYLQLSMCAANCLHQAGLHRRHCSLLPGVSFES